MITNPARGSAILRMTKVTLLMKLGIRLYLLLALAFVGASSAVLAQNALPVRPLATQKGFSNIRIVRA
jgi:hypothetical protein